MSFDFQGCRFFLLMNLRFLLLLLSTVLASGRHKGSSKNQPNSSGPGNTAAKTNASSLFAPEPEVSPLTFPEPGKTTLALQVSDIKKEVATLKNIGIAASTIHMLTLPIANYFFTLSHADAITRCGEISNMALATAIASTGVVAEHLALTYYGKRTWKYSAFMLLRSALLIIPVLFPEINLVTFTGLVGPLTSACAMVFIATIFMELVMILY